MLGTTKTATGTQVPMAAGMQGKNQLWKLKLADDLAVIRESKILISEGRAGVRDAGSTNLCRGIAGNVFADKPHRPITHCELGSPFVFTTRVVANAV